MSDAKNQISVEDLFNQHHEKLNLVWVAGQLGGKRIIYPETPRIEPKKPGERKRKKASAKKSNKVDSHIRSLVGYLNLIHPHQIQVLGETEIKYLEELRDISKQDAVRQIFNHDPACLIVAEDKPVPTILKRKCNEHKTALFTSSLPSIKLTDLLHYYLTNLFADILTMHGVFMEVMAIGVLITGPSGIGKSELAMELITRGHRLVADDAPQFSRIAPDIINGTCPEALQDFLEVRGLGIINVRELFGDSAIKTNKYLRVIIHLEPMANDKVLELNRLEGSYRQRDILDLQVAEITLPVAPGRNLAVMVECAARNHILRNSGYNAADDFSDRQREIIGRSTG